MPNPDTLVGAVIDDRYRLASPIGAGGVGAVYRAAQIHGGPDVALKLLHDQYDDAESRERFTREARALNGLQHPNIVGVIDFGIFRDAPYLVMELLDGATLDAVIERGETKEPELAASLIADVLSGMAYAHAQGVLHRDLKPENVFVARGADGKWTAKLLDFGLAKFVDQDRWGQDDKLTTTGAIVGTPAYMSPEQGTGQRIDARSDVYSAGVLLFEIFTGQWPFMEEDRLAMLRAHLIGKVPAIGGARSDLDVRPELEALVQKAMAKKPADRFADCAAMLDALRAIPAPAARLSPNAAPLSPPPVARTERPPAHELETPSLDAPLLDPTLRDLHRSDPIEPASRSLRWVWMSAAVLLIVATIVFALRIAR